MTDSPHNDPAVDEPLLATSDHVSENPPPGLPEQITLEIPVAIADFIDGLSRHKRREQGLVFTRSFLLVLAAAGGIMEFVVDTHGSRVDVGGLFLLSSFFLSWVVARWVLERDPDRSFDKLQAAAELAESAVWRFAACARPMTKELDEDRAEYAYRGQLHDIEAYLLGDGVDPGTLMTESMVQLRRSDFELRKRAYIDQRVKPAQTSYRCEALRTRRAATAWKVVAYLAEIAGFTGGLLKVINITDIDFLGLAGVVVASIGSWVTSSNYANRSHSAAAKSRMLEEASITLEATDSEDWWNTFVGEIEDRLALDANAALATTAGQQFRSLLQTSAVRQMSAEGYFSAVKELGDRLGQTSPGKSKFDPDLVIALNPGGAIVGGILYFMKRPGFPFFPLSLRSGLRTERVQQILSWSLEPFDQQPGCKILVIDASMKSGSGFADIMPILEEVCSATLPNTEVDIRTAVIAYRPDRATEPEWDREPDYYIDQFTDEFPYGEV